MGQAIRCIFYYSAQATPNKRMPLMSFAQVYNKSLSFTLCWCYHQQTYSLLVLSFTICCRCHLLFVGVITNKLLYFSVITNKPKHKCINFNVKRFAQGIGADILFMA